MKVKINGEYKEFSNEIHLFDLLNRMDLPTERIAIELNKAVIGKKEWKNTKVKDLDNIEIIHFVGGG